MNSTITTKLDDITFTILEVERKNKVPFKHYGQQFYVEKTSIDRIPKLKKFIEKHCNVLETKRNVKIYIERDIHWGLGIYLEWECVRESELSFNKVTVKGLMTTTRIPIQSIIEINIKIICAIQKKS